MSVSGALGISDGLAQVRNLHNLIKLADGDTSDGQALRIRTAQRATDTRGTI